MTAERTAATLTPPRRLHTANARQSISGEVRLPAYPCGPSRGPARPFTEGRQGPARPAQTVYRPYEPAGRAAPRNAGSTAPRRSAAAYARQAARKRAERRARRVRRRLAALLMLAGLFAGLLALRGLAPEPAEAAAGPEDAPLPPAAAEPSATAELPAVAGPSVIIDPPVSAEAAVAARIYALQGRYPQNYYWNHAGPDLNGYGVTEVPCPSHDSYATCNSYVYNGDTSYQCRGFAKVVFEDVFGQKCDDLPKNYDIENVMVGDYVRFGDEHAGHSFIVLERDGDEVAVLECNIGGRCIIQWGRVQSLSGALNYGSASSPKYVYFSYSVHASNYDETGMPAGSAMPEYPSYPFAPNDSFPGS